VELLPPHSKEVSMKRLITLLLMSLIVSADVYADTTSDLIAVYNNSIRIPTSEEITSFNRELNEYSKLLQKDKRIKEFNASTDDAIKYREQLIFEAQTQVSELLVKSREEADYITMNIYGDFKELASRDNNYKRTVSAAAATLDKINKYTIPVKLDSIEYDLESMRQELETKKEALETPEVEKTDYEYELGDVFRIQNIVGTPYVVSSPWGSRLDPVTKTTIQYHNGVDIHCPVGTAVTAMFNGEVLEAGDNWALGNYVRVKHGNGIVTIYGHLSSLSVISGDRVRQYDLIGYSGQSGNKCSEPKIFISLFIRGQSVDPDLILRNGARQ